jgi:multiple sugar transport system permease protein
VISIRKAIRRDRWLPVRYGLLVIALIWSLFPLYWMLITAFKSNVDIFDLHLEFWPHHPTLENFGELWNGILPVRSYLTNSVITSVASAVVATVVSILAAYSISRGKVRGASGIQLGLLGSQMFPLVVLLVPLYILFRHSGLLNTNLGLVIAFTSFTIPVGIWFMKGFIDSVPRELDEAAKIDGCNDLQVLWHVLVPVLWPGIVAVMIFAFLDAWNNLLFPLALTTQDSARTLPPGLLEAVDSQFRDDWGGLMAGSIVTALPPIVGFVIAQRWIIRGLVAGALKG